MEEYNQDSLKKEALSKVSEAKARIHFADLIAHRDYHQALAELNKWTIRCELAYKKGDMDLLSKAKFQKERYQAITTRLEKLLGEQIPQIDSLKQNLSVWEEKIPKANNILLKKENHVKHVSSTIFEDLEDDVKDTSQAIFENIDEELENLKREIANYSPPQLQAKNEQNPQETLGNIIKETKKALKIAGDVQTKILQDYELAKNEVDKYHTKAQFALQNSDDNLALNSLIAKTVQIKIAIVLENQLEQQRETVTFLNNHLIALENLKLTLN